MDPSVICNIVCSKFDTDAEACKALCSDDRSPTTRREACTSKQGDCVFANRSFAENELVCLYEVKIDGDGDPKYDMWIPDDETVGSVESVRDDVLYGVTFFGPLANEPNEDQTSNVSLQQLTSHDGTAVVGMYASRDIPKDEEIVWCYGQAYPRDYDTPCTDRTADVKWL